MDKKGPTTPTQQHVPDPNKSFKPIKTINKGNKGIYCGLIKNRLWLDSNRENDSRKWKYAACCRTSCR